MKKRIFFLCLIALILTGCGSEKPEVPFQPLAQITPDAERMQAIEDALSEVSPSVAVPESPEATPTTPAAAPDFPDFPEVIEAPAEQMSEIPPTAVPTMVPQDENGFIAAEDDPFSVHFDDDPLPESSAEGQWWLEPTEESQIVEMPVIDFGAPETVPFVQEPVEESKAAPQQQEYQGYNENGQYYYTLHEGEPLSCLARRYNIELSSLFAYNGISSDAEAPAGTTVILPTQVNMWSVYDGPRITLRHPCRLTVTDERNLFEAACKFGDVFPEDIAAQNGMDVFAPLTVGQEIIIP